MNTDDDKRLEELAQEVLEVADQNTVWTGARPPLVLRQSIFAALHEAVEPYRKQVEELKSQLELTVKGSFGATQAMAAENALLRAENEALKAKTG